MSFKRQKFNEEYNTTADWLVDFAKKLQKKSYNIENLTNIRQMNDGPKKFATIEEKMADIKARIGFDAINSMHEEERVKTASHSDCPCGGPSKDACACDVEVKTASENKEHKEEDLRAMSNILSYIRDLCEHEHEKLTPVMVISRCREEPGLRFDDLPINIEELKGYISEVLDKYSTDEEEVKYIARDDEQTQDQNQEPEYRMHASPQGG